MLNIGAMARFTKLLSFATCAEHFRPSRYGSKVSAIAQGSECGVHMTRALGILLNKAAEAVLQICWSLHSLILLA